MYTYLYIFLWLSFSLRSFSVHSTRSAPNTQWGSELAGSQAARFIVNAANLIAPVMEKTAVLGYDWLIEALNHHGFPRIASELEIAKASYFLRYKEFDQAIMVLKV